MALRDAAEIGQEARQGKRKGACDRDFHALERGRRVPLTRWSRSVQIAGPSGLDAAGELGVMTEAAGRWRRRCRVRVGADREGLRTSFLNNADREDRLAARNTIRWPRHRHVARRDRARDCRSEPVVEPVDGSARREVAEVRARHHIGGRGADDDVAVGKSAQVQRRQPVFIVALRA